MNKNITPKLINLGLSTDEADLYTLLIANGPHTGSEIRSELGWGASKVDAVIYQLIHKQLLESLAENGRILYRPTSFENLQNIVQLEKEKQQKLEQKLSLLDFENQTQSPLFKDAKIIQYHGINGLKQVLWNTTKASELIQGYEYLENSAYMDFSIMDDIRSVLAQKKIKTQSIMNATSYGAFTAVTEYLEFYECRYIDPNDIKFHHEVMIYNDVYTIFRADKNGIFCTEIHNQKLVDFQRQLFRYIWQRAQHLTVLSSNGALGI